MADAHRRRRLFHARHRTGAVGRNAVATAAAISGFVWLVSSGTIKLATLAAAQQA